MHIRLFVYRARCVGTAPATVAPHENKQKPGEKREKSSSDEKKKRPKEEVERRRTKTRAAATAEGFSDPDSLLP